MKLGMIFFACLVIAGGTACIHTHGHAHGGHPHSYEVVHVHGFDCGHVFINGVWVIKQGGGGHGRHGHPGKSPH